MDKAMMHIDDVKAQEPGMELSPRRAQGGAFRGLPLLRSIASILLASLLIGSLLIAMSFYTPCYILKVEGAEVGYVRSQDMVTESTKQVGEEIAQILGRDYALNVDVDMTFAIAPKQELLSYSRLSEMLYGSSEDIKPAYELTVDGVSLGMVEDIELLNETLETVKEQYVSENTEEVYFAGESRITQTYISKEETLLTKEDILEAVSQQVPQETSYEVKAGDTVDSVAKQYQMTEEELLSKNAVIAPEGTLEEGQVITVEKAAPRLSVYTVDETTYTQKIARPVREVEDPSMYVGDRKVIEEGRDGQEEIFAERTHFNGEVQKETILSRTVLEEPVESVVAVGTMERPPYYSTGSLQWPT